MKVVDAREHADGTIEASVEFPDGLTQSVVLPSWATKQNIKDEAKRLRDKAEATEKAKKVRGDLKD